MRRRFCHPLWILLATAAGCPDTSQPDDAAPPETDATGPDLRPTPDLPQDIRADSLAPLVISQLKLEPNPHNVLSCFVSWRTNRAATSRVDFWRSGATGGLARAVTSAGLHTTHRVLVIGMLAQTSYSLQAVSRSGGDPRRSAVKKYQTGKLPLHVVTAELVTHDPRATHAGWTLMSISAGSRAGGKVTMDPQFVPTAVIYDMQGRPVWYHEHGLPRVGDTRYFDGRVLAQSMGSIHEPKPAAVELDLAGRLVWQGPWQPRDTVHRHFHHHFEKLASGNYLALRNVLVRRLLGDEIVELTPDHQVIWSWNSFDHLKPQMWRWDGKGNFDYTHGNSLQLDADRDVLYYNARHQDAVFKIDRKTGKVLWRLGDGGDFKQDPAAKDPWFLKAHAVEVQPNGNVLLYDNGMTKRPFSRALEYRLDEQQMTATIAWQYRGTPDHGWQTLYWGDADRLPNGNTLICAGTWAATARSRIFEVTAGGRRVWEIKLPHVKQSGLTIGAYNAQRLRPPLTTVRRSSTGDAG